MTEPQAAFAAALAAFQKELPAVGKDQSAKVQTKAGGSYSYDYADLTTIAGKVLPLLAGHGLSFLALPTWGSKGFVLAYSLLHEGGYSADGEYPLPDPSNHSPQEVGSAITYARRYCLCSVTGIAPGGDDDDGQAAAQSRAAAPRPQQARQDDPVLTAAKSALWRTAQQNMWTAQMLEDDFARQHDGLTLSSATVDMLDAYRAQLESDLVAP